MNTTTNINTNDKVLDEKVLDEKMIDSVVDPSAEEEIDYEDPSAEEELDYDDTLEIIMPIDLDVLLAA